MNDLRSSMLELLGFNNNGEFYGTITGTIEGDFKKRWQYWIKKLISINKIEDFVDIIPTGAEDN